MRYSADAPYGSPQVCTTTLGTRSAHSRLGCNNFKNSDDNFPLPRAVMQRSDVLACELTAGNVTAGLAEYSLCYLEI